MEYNDGHTAYLAENFIAKNLFAQVDQAGNRFIILDSTTGTRTDGAQVLHQDEFVHTSTGTKRRVNRKKVWEIFIQWKESSTIWNPLKNVKYL